MYNYTICNQADAGLFCQQCKALKDNIWGRTSYPGFRAFAGNADKDTEGATRHNKSKDAHGEMPLPGIKEECLLEDVDGTATAEYSHPKGRVIVKNDYQVNAIYVISDFDLLPYFQ